MLIAFQYSDTGLAPVGELRLKLMFNPVTEDVYNETRGTLHVTIENAKSYGQTNSYVMLHLLPDKSKKGLRKTLKKNDMNPVWDEEFTYKDVTLGELRMSRALEVVVLDHDIDSEDIFVGCLHLGSCANMVTKPYEWMDSNPEESCHWEEMLCEPGKWIEHWHTLRPSMDFVHPDASPAVPLSPINDGLLQSSELSLHKGENLSKKTQPQSEHEAVQNQVQPSKKTHSSKQSDITVLAPSADPFSKDSNLEHNGSTSTSESGLSSEGVIDDSKQKYDITGEIMLGVVYEDGTLAVHVCRAQDLTSTNKKGYPNPYVKTYLLPDRSKKSKRKTKVRKKTIDPVYDTLLKVRK